MYPSTTFLLVTLLILTSVSPTLHLAHATTLNIHTRHDPIPPSQDPFYAQPPGFESHAPGTILKHRRPPHPPGVFGKMELVIQEAWQIQYTTTTPMGNATTAVTTLLIPENVNSTRLVSFQDIQDASSLDCAPSYAIQMETTSQNTLSKQTIFFEAGLLKHGYMVSIPDYQSYSGAFASGPQEAYATLDSLRAILAFEKRPPSTIPLQIALWGYSGGSIATEWAAELQPTYAPELKEYIVGAAIGGVVANLAHSIKSMNKTPYAGLGIAGLWGLYNSDHSPALLRLLDEEVYPQKRTEFEFPLHQCATQDFSTFHKKDVFTYFRSGSAILDHPVLKQILNEQGIMGQNSLPLFPLYVYKARRDPVNKIEDTDELVKGYCERGIKSLRYVRNMLGDHTSEALVGSGGAAEFILERFEGRRAVEGCKRSNVWIENVSWGKLRELGGEAWGLIRGLFGLRPLVGEVGDEERD